MELGKAMETVQTELKKNKKFRNTFLASIRSILVELHDITDDYECALRILKRIAGED